MIYVYRFDCKKGCKIDCKMETDIKDVSKLLKMTCPVCGARIYKNDEKTTIINPKLKTKQSKTEEKEQEIEKRLIHKEKNKKIKEKGASVV